MELDTGFAISAITHKYYIKYFSSLKLKKTDTQRQTYTKEKIIPNGFLIVTVEYRGRHYKQLKLYVLEKCSAPLFGRDWLKIIKLDWTEIKEFHITCFEGKNTTVHSMKGETNDTYSGDKVKSLLEKYSEMFKEGVRTLKHINKTYDKK